MKHSLGVWLFERRVDANLSRADVAKHAGLSVDIIRQIEEGRLVDPTLDQLWRLAVVFQVDVHDLVQQINVPIH